MQEKWPTPKPSRIQTVQIYTDGACTGNPGPGGWGVVLFCNGNQAELSGGDRSTTNNRMELTAAIEGLGCLKRKCRVELYTDSEYVRLGITSWIKKWKAKDWKRNKTEDVKNADLWKDLDRLNSAHQVQWIHVKAHSGNEWNEYVDKLAKKAIPK